MAAEIAGVVDLTKHEVQNYIRLHLLVVNIATYVLKVIFDNAVPPAQLHHVLQQHIKSIDYGKKKKIINQGQYDLLYPQGLPHSETFDVTLLLYMLRSICGFDRKCKWWAEKDNTKIADTEVDEVADIVRIRNIRNQIQHASKTSLDQKDFDVQWDMLEKAMLRLGTKYNLASLKSEIETVRNQPFETVKEKVIVIMQSHDLDDDYGDSMDDRFDDDYDFYDDGYDIDYEDHDIDDGDHYIHDGDHDIDDGDHDIDDEDHDVDYGNHDIDDESHDIDDRDHDIDDEDHNVDHDIDDGNHDIDDGDHDIDDGDHDVDYGNHDIDHEDHDVGYENHDIDDGNHDIDHEDHDVDADVRDIDNDDNDRYDIDRDIDDGGYDVHDAADSSQWYDDHDDYDNGGDYD